MRATALLCALAAASLAARPAAAASAAVPGTTAAAAEAPPRGAATLNEALLFVKPEAATEQVLALVRETLAARRITVTQSGTVDGPAIDRLGLIDAHYGAIARRARAAPADLRPSAAGRAAFLETFGETWDAAVARGAVKRPAELAATPTELSAQWHALERGVDLCKLGGGYYCGRLSADAYVVNGFYGSMRAAFTRDSAKVCYFACAWPAAALPFSAFRTDVLGATDPAAARPGSLRRTLHDDFAALGLAARPDVGTNGVHGSASPLEAALEHANWFRAPRGGTRFERALAAALGGKEGAAVDLVDALEADPVAFDLLEELDADECVKRAVELGEAAGE